MTDRARELLEQALIDFECAKEYTGIDYCIVDKIRDFLAESEVKQDDEPVATLDHNGNFKLLRMVGVTVGQPINLYEHPAPRKPFVRLSEEEIETAYGNSGHYQTLRPQDRFGVFALARAIMDALEEKNK